MIPYNKKYKSTCLDRLAVIISISALVRFERKPVSFQKCSVELRPGGPQVLPRLLQQTMSSCSSFCAQGNCHAGTNLGLFGPVKRNRNSTAYKDILYDIFTVLCLQLCR